LHALIKDNFFLFSLSRRFYNWLSFIFSDLRDVRGRVHLPGAEQRVRQPLGVPVSEEPARVARQAAGAEQRQVRRLRERGVGSVRSRPLPDVVQAQENEPQEPEGGLR